MKQLFFVLLITTSMIHAMEEKPNQEKKQEKTSEFLRRMLGQERFADLQFRTALNFINQSPDAIRHLNISSDLQDYILKIKKDLGEKLLTLLSEIPLSEVNKEYALKLIENGADITINKQDRWGGTVLALAAAKGEKDIVKSLLTHGADVNIQNNFGRTPLMDALISKHKDIAEILIDAGSNPNIQNSDRYTALMFAAQRGYSDIVELLLKRGADISITNETNQTALDIAREVNHPAVIEQLAAAQKDKASN